LETDDASFFSHIIGLLVSASASVAYSSLWCSVLDNGALMASYLLWRNVEPSDIGMWRGIGVRYRCSAIVWPSFPLANTNVEHLLFFFFSFNVGQAIFGLAGKQ
jgi:hypothetical protein